MRNLFKFIDFGFIKRFFIVLVFIFYFCNCIGSLLCKCCFWRYFWSVFRLHVIANSDSQEDQNLKYKVRDKILEYMNEISIDCSSKEEVIALAKENQEKFQDIAKKVIKENGYDYDVNVSIGNYEFLLKIMVIYLYPLEIMMHCE